MMNAEKPGSDVHAEQQVSAKHMLNLDNIIGRVQKRLPSLKEVIPPVLR